MCRKLLVTDHTNSADKRSTHRIITTTWIIFIENSWWISEKIYDWFVVYYSLLLQKRLRFSRLRLPSASLPWLITSRQTSYVSKIISHFSCKQITCEKNHRFSSCARLSSSLWLRIFYAWLNIWRGGTYLCALRYEILCTYN